MYYPKGTRVMFSIIGIHTSPKYFENPDKFDPERFMPENADKLNKHSFVPFSVGPRNCIGKNNLFLLFLSSSYFVDICFRETICSIST